MSVQEAFQAPGLTVISFARIPEILRAPPIFLEKLPLAIYACDAGGRILWFNSKAIELWGRTPRLHAALDLFRKHGIRCIFATAHDDGPARARARLSNPLGWLAKPYTMTALVEMVRRSLGDLTKR